MLGRQSGEMTVGDRGQGSRQGVAALAHRAVVPAGRLSLNWDPIPRAGLVVAQGTGPLSL